MDVRDGRRRHPWLRALLWGAGAGGAPAPKGRGPGRAAACKGKKGGPCARLAAAGRSIGILHADLAAWQEGRGGVGVAIGR